jgi:predicted  nucleic acid-binding Zn-ribbon protein
VNLPGPALLALQRIDSELDQLAARKARLPERAALAEVEQRLAALRIEQARQQAAIDAAQTAIEAGEHEGAQLDKQRVRLEAQMKTIIAPREAEALTHEIDGLRAKRSLVDDAELEAMEQQADAEAALERLAADEAALDQEVAVARAALDDALAALTAVEQEVAQRRTGAAGALDAAALDMYAATRKRHGGVGFVSIDGRSCSGCHVDMSLGEFEQLRSAPAGELPECPNCGRLVVV